MDYQSPLIEKYGHQEVYSMSSSTDDEGMLNSLVEQIPHVYLPQLASNPNLKEDHIRQILSDAGDIAVARSVYDNIMRNPATTEKTLRKLINQYPRLVTSLSYRDDFTAPFLHMVIEKLSHIQERPNMIYPSIRYVLFNPNVYEKTLRLILKTWPNTPEIMTMVSQHENVTPGMLLHMAKTTQQASLMITIANSAKVTDEILNTIWRKKTSKKVYLTILENPNVPVKIVENVFATVDDGEYLQLLRLNPNYKTKLVELLKSHFEDVANTMPQAWLETLATTISVGKPKKELKE